jgi:hypothetical protein
MTFFRSDYRAECDVPVGKSPQVNKVLLLPSLKANKRPELNNHLYFHQCQLNNEEKLISFTDERSPLIYFSSCQQNK